jgi:hypothetical protein
LTILALVLMLSGCGPTASDPQPAPTATTALPPEVEFDPVTATEKHRAAQKAPRR